MDCLEGHGLWPPKGKTRPLHSFEKHLSNPEKRVDSYFLNHRPILFGERGTCHAPSIEAVRANNSSVAGKLENSVDT